VVVVVAKAEVYQVKVPLAQLLVIFTGLPAQIGVELNVGLSGKAAIVTVRVAEALAQPFVPKTV
jgi:hypothetical protein